MEILPYIYLAYMFISLYFLTLMLLVYLKHRKSLFEVPELKKHFSVSVLIPVYNEEDAIKDTLDSVFKSDYDNISEVIVINDGSKDKTSQIVKGLMKRYSKLKLIDKKNSGKADSINQGIKVAKGELIAVVDSDSFPQADAIRKMIGFFEDEKVGAATCPILARNRNTFFEKIQAIEYSMIALTRKLLEPLNAIYVTPGPLALYRKKALLEVGGFDKNNLTEDIELTWHLTAAGWQRKMALNTKVTTIVPNKFTAWWKQRKRWSVGGFQTIWKYRKYFLKEGILGFFILPLFLFSTVLGLFGLGIFVYLGLLRIIKEYLIIKLSFLANAPILTMNQFYFTPTVLNYLGFVLFVIGIAYTFVILSLMKEDIWKGKSIMNILFFMIIYLAVYPLITISAIFKLVKRDLTW